MKTSLGLFLVSLATLLDEILLTRIFSVMTWYHFAFLAVSIALFGMTLGAIAVQARRRALAGDGTDRPLAVAALLFAWSLSLGLLIQIRIPFSTVARPGAILGDAAILALATLPFVFSGVCVCLVLTRFPERVGRLYAADLGGAALACVVVVRLLEAMDGPTAILAAASIAAAGAAAFATDTRSPRLLAAAVLTAIVLACATTGLALEARGHPSLLRLAAVKGAREEVPIYERWNSFSRIRVRPAETGAPLGWGMSRVYRAQHPVRQLVLDIDGGASTVLTEYHGDPAAVDHLRYDVTGLVHYLRPGGTFLAIGAGGGRDILTALLFGQRGIIGVEINEAILEALTGPFGDFTGHLDRDPRVLLVNDEARSYITRQTGRFDIIQASLIDTSAATAAGAFVFTENSIYTTEAWTIFLNRLTPRGILSFSWYYGADRPVEMYRLTSLARTALGGRGIEDPRPHIILVRQKVTGRGVATLLVSPSPFSAEDLTTLDAIVASLQFDVVLAPGREGDEAFADIAAGRIVSTIGADPPLRIDAPTDDAPFFFSMVRLRDALRPATAAGGSVGGNQRAVVLLGALLLGVIVLLIACLIPPLVLIHRDAASSGSIPLLLFFTGIGLGFMLVETSQMQRLIVFLGHPTYGLTVVLFALLLAGGAGSFSTRRIPATGIRRSGGLRLLALVAVLLAFGGATPAVIGACAAWPTPARLALATAILLPIGFFMGMAFPLGMMAAGRKREKLLPWFWGVNGAASVCASVLATAIALSWGIAASFWTGALCYAIAAALFALARAPGRLTRDAGSPEG